jgi:hypothetical protein
VTGGRSENGAPMVPLADFEPGLRVASPHP